MELAIPVPPIVEFIQYFDCHRCLGRHFEDSHILSHSSATFDAPDIYSPYSGFELMRLAHEYTCKPSRSMLVLNWIPHTECTNHCQQPDWFIPKYRLLSPEKQCSGTKEEDKLHGTFFTFLDFPREIRDDIYVRVLGSSKEYWAVMTASVRSRGTGRPDPDISHTRFEYSFGSKELQLLCRQIRNEVLEICQSYSQDLWLRDLGVNDFDAVVSIFERKKGLRRSARSITLVYSTPILSRRGKDRRRSTDGCSFLTQIIEPFQYLVKLCPNVESVFISLVADTPSGSRDQFGLYIPCHNRKETKKVQVNERWYKVAEWESVIRYHFSRLLEGIPLEENNLISWDYSCSCVVSADIMITVSEGEKERARQGARRINATVKKGFYGQNEFGEEVIWDI